VYDQSLQITNRISVEIFKIWSMVVLSNYVQHLSASVTSMLCLSNVETYWDILGVLFPVARTCHCSMLFVRYRAPSVLCERAKSQGTQNIWLLWYICVHCWNVLITRSFFILKYRYIRDLIYGIQSMPCTHACAFRWRLQLSLQRPSS
jgi:hypothetical protein